MFGKLKSLILCFIRIILDIHCIMHFKLSSAVLYTVVVHNFEIIKISLKTFKLYYDLKTQNTKPPLKHLD